LRRAGTSSTPTLFTTFAVLLCASLCLGGCEKTSHKNLDKWMGTEKGPGKLKKALNSGKHDAKLRAHAASNLIRIAQLKDVQEAFKKMDASDRTAILTELVPRLWKLARLDNAMAAPQTIHMKAKDALFHLRTYADAANKDKIDNYLIDWLTGGYYDGRAKSGSVAGSAIIGTIGAKAGARMRTVLEKALAAPDDKRFEIQLPTLLGVALTGEAKSVDLLLKSAHTDLGRPKLAARVYSALYAAYIKPINKYYKPANPAALKPHMKRLQSVMLGGDKFVDTAIQLIAAAGAPECLGPLVQGVARDDSRLVLRYVSAQNALKCGKLKAVIRVAEAFPTSGSYNKDDLGARLWVDMVRLKPSAAVAKQARTLLNSDSWVAKLTGMEVLSRLKLADTAAADAKLVAALAKDKTKLRGWWGDQDEVAKSKRKKTPTLGQRAKEVAKVLEELAKGTKK